MSSSTDAWEKALGGWPAYSPRPAELPRATEVSKHRATQTSRSSKPVAAKRLDIQGLRMVAVVAVFVNHVSGHPKGAFTGVDVFFVISGFLITGLLVRDASREGMNIGRFFGGFYERRARRILPAAIVVLAASWVAGNLTFKGARADQSHTDIWWSFGFSANVHFARIGTDYFRQSQPPSIAQHFWSLAVEEQFYLVWPVVVLLVIMVIGRRRRSSHSLLLAVVTVLSLASFIYAIRDTSTSPTTAYFSTFARAWELGVGAILAVLRAQFPRLVSPFGRASGPIALAGVAAIVVSFFVVDPSRGFPAPWGAFPVLATALVILANAGASRWARVLTNRFSIYLGEISYSLYLWHWPAIIIISALIPGRTDLYFATVVAAALGLSIFSFEFIETPLRTPRQNRLEGEQRPRRATAVIAAALIVIALGGYTFKPSPTVRDFSSLIPAASQQTTRTEMAAASASLKTAIIAALQKDHFPKLSPDLSHLGTTAAVSDWFGCNTGSQFLTSCTFKSSTTPSTRSKTVLLVGDSIMLAWMPAIRAALPSNWTVYGYARQQCTASYVSWTAKLSTASISQGCDRHHAALAARVKQIRPDLVIMSSATEVLDRLRSSATGDAAVAEYQRGMIETDRIVAAPGREVITLSPPPPRSSSLSACDTAVATPSDCAVSIPAKWYLQAKADEAASKATRTRYIDTQLWFCADSGYCPSFVGNTPMFYDSNHITKAYALMIAPQLIAQLKL